MKLSEIEVDDFIAALRKERSAWIDVPSKEGRRHTEAEKATMAILLALENAVRDAAAQTERRTWIS